MIEGFVIRACIYYQSGVWQGEAQDGQIWDPFGCRVSKHNKRDCLLTKRPSQSTFSSRVKNIEQQTSSRLSTYVAREANVAVSTVSQKS